MTGRAITPEGVHPDERLGQDDMATRREGEFLAAALRQQAARAADVTVVVVGETAAMSGEAAARSSIDLPGVQQQLVAAIEETGKPFVVVLVNGRPLTIPYLHDNAPAILEAWAPGVQGGHGGPGLGADLVLHGDRADNGPLAQHVQHPGPARGPGGGVLSDLRRHGQVKLAQHVRAPNEDLGAVHGGAGGQHDAPGQLIEGHAAGREGASGAGGELGGSGGVGHGPSLPVDGGVPATGSGETAYG